MGDDFIPEAMDIQNVVEELLFIRGYFENIKKAREEQDAPYHARKAALDAEVIRRCMAEGRNNQRTNAGTAYMKDHVSIKMDAPDSFREWVKANEEWSCAEIRASKTGVEDWLEEHNELPPGIHREVSIVVAVRKE